MNNDRNTNCTDVAIKNNKKSMQKHLIYSLICIAIALISFFAISKWATSADTYSRIINTLNELQKKACSTSHTTLESLKRALTKAWADHDLNFICNAFGSFPRRLWRCIRANGGYFEKF